MKQQPPKLIFYTIGAFSLCEITKEVVRPLCDEVGIQLSEIDTSNSPELIAIHWEEVPTGYLNGRKVLK